MRSEVENFISNFDKDYSKNEALIYELFEEGGFSLSEQKEIFDALQTKQKCQLFNTISLTARDNYCEFLKELEPTVNDKGKTIVPFDDFISKIRGQAVKDKISNEMRLLDEGKCTRDWSLDQIKDMFQFSKKTDKLSTVPGTPKAYDEYGNPLYYIVNNNGKYTVKQYSIDGHHIKNVNDNPLLAGDSNNIQMLSRAPENGNMSEHQLAHGGNFSNETIAYYDGENYIGVDFTSPVVNEEGKYTPGEYKGNGKAYYFDDELGFVEITDETNSSYIADTLLKQYNRKSSEMLCKRF